MTRLYSRILSLLIITTGSPGTARIFAQDVERCTVGDVIVSRPDLPSPGGASLGSEGEEVRLLAVQKQARHLVDVATAGSDGFEGMNTKVLGSCDPGDIVIPVAFHVIRHSVVGGFVSASSLHAQISKLNSAFGGTRFCFSWINQSGYAVTNNDWFYAGIGSAEEVAMKQSLAVNPASTLNFYTVGSGSWAVFPFVLETIEQGNFVCEPANCEPYPEDSFIHGVVVNHTMMPEGTAANNDGSMGVHEVGHYLGLFHTFHLTNQNASGNVCHFPGDSVEDTPYHRASELQCAAVSTSCENESDPVPYQNYMNGMGTNVTCRNSFSDGQLRRIEWVVSEYKPTLVSGQAPTVLQLSDQGIATNEIIHSAQEITIASVSGSRFAIEEDPFRPYDPHVELRSGSTISISGEISLGLGASVLMTIDGTLASKVFTPPEQEVEEVVDMKGGGTEVDLEDAAPVQRDVPDNIAVSVDPPFPNPFAYETKIEFTIAQAAPVRVAVYNVMGQEIRLLSNRRYPQGRHSILWDGTADGRVPLGNGVFFVRVDAGVHGATNRVVLVR